MLEFVSLLKSNRSLLSLDLRFNSGFGAKTHRRVAMALLRNIKAAQKDPSVTEERWIKPELLTIEVPESMLHSIEEKVHLMFPVKKQRLGAPRAPAAV